MGPRFRAEESWDGLGDVDIWFADNTSQDLRDRVGQELQKMIPRLHKHARSAYHLESLVEHIFARILCTGNLRYTRQHQWVWTEETTWQK